MCRVLIFGGTTEGRLIAEYCERIGICADVSVATEYGAKLLEKGEYLRILTGRLDQKMIQKLLLSEKYIMVIDATHPFAVEVTENIRNACENVKTPYLRLVRRKSTSDYGIRVQSMEEMISVLNKTDGVVLSTLGTKELDHLKGVKDHFRRIWIRALPSEKLADLCENKGFDRKKLILEQGPFSVEQNLRHLSESGADILITKESGETGGFPEKVRAAEKSGTQLIALAAPLESGLSSDEIISVLEGVK